MKPIHLPDLHDLRDAILAGATTSQAELDKAWGIAHSDVCEHVFLRHLSGDAPLQPDIDHLAQLPLAGLAVSVKDLFDVAGQVSCAGSLILADRPAAKVDATAIARLKRAGAAMIGRTNMTEFAFSGVGINPHIGTPVNPADPDISRIPGGSSSGAAVSVAVGAAHVGLGSDTGGSIRIPAALQGLVGFKSTACLVPSQGTVPLSKSLDTVCAITRSVRDAVLAHEILAARTVIKSPAPLNQYKLAVIENHFLDELDITVARAFGRSLEQLQSAGARITRIHAQELDELAAMNAGGGLPAAESFAWHKDLIEQHGKQYDPRVMARIQRGSGMSASDYIHLVEQRADWIRRMQMRISGFDAILSPTVPIVAPPIGDVAPGAERDTTFFRINGLLLRNPSVVNTLDGCAASLPCHALGELPVGLMVWAGALHDDTVLNLSLLIEKALKAHDAHSSL
jgi:amidase/aspartyl-tRNA(Asn)/glutamyl-tRNA(Gln) amidotransferase subunit A